MCRGSWLRFRTAHTCECKASQSRTGHKPKSKKTESVDLHDDTLWYPMKPFPKLWLFPGAQWNSRYLEPPGFFLELADSGVNLKSNSYLYVQYHIRDLNLITKLSSQAEITALLWLVPRVSPTQTHLKGNMHCCQGYGGWLHLSSLGFLYMYNLYILYINKIYTESLNIGLSLG